MPIDSLAGERRGAAARRKAGRQGRCREDGRAELGAAVPCRAFSLPMPPNTPARCARARARGSARCAGTNDMIPSKTLSIAHCAAVNREQAKEAKPRLRAKMISAPGALQERRRAAAAPLPLGLDAPPTIAGRTYDACASGRDQAMQDDARRSHIVTLGNTFRACAPPAAN